MLRLLALVSGALGAHPETRAPNGASTNGTILRLILTPSFAVPTLRVDHDDEHHRAAKHRQRVKNQINRERGFSELLAERC